MNRLLLIPALLLALASGPLSAQRGGHASAGGHAGMASHGSAPAHSGGFSAGHGFSGGRAGFSGHASARGSNFHQFRGGRNFSHSRGTGLRIRTFRNNCFGFACRGRFGNSWWYAGAFDPSWWWDSGSSYDPDREREIGRANEMNAQSLDEQRTRQQDDQGVYARFVPPTPHAPETTNPAPATVLVFRDQHKKDLQNYAIVGQTLWNFAPQHTEKISLSDLDLPATSKANDERGVDFRVPGANEGQ